TLAWLTWAPVLALLFPPTALLLVHTLGEPGQEYRLLYAFPVSFIWVECMRRALSRLPRLKEPHAALLSCLVIAWMGLRWDDPWYGRLRLQIHRPAAERTLIPQDVTAEWFRVHRQGLKGCTLLTDNITDFAITTHLADSVQRSGRIAPSHTARLMKTLEELLT